MTILKKKQNEPLSAVSSTLQFPQHSSRRAFPPPGSARDHSRTASETYSCFKLIPFSRRGRENSREKQKMYTECIKTKCSPHRTGPGSPPTLPFNQVNRQTWWSRWIEGMQQFPRFLPFPLDGISSVWSTSKSPKSWRE